MFAYCGNNPVVNSDPSGKYFMEIAEAILDFFANIFGSSSSTGAAQDYEEIPAGHNGNAPNCYAYAVGAPVNKQPGGTSKRKVTDWSDVKDVAASVKADLNSEGYTVRRLSGASGKILENEYRIALRVGTSPYDKDKYGLPMFDYHFMVQTSTGQWAEKHGSRGGTYLWDVGVTPNEANWSFPGDDNQYYDSPIVYFAISKWR